jgi:hypothetical protein
MERNTRKSAVFEETYRKYLQDLSSLDIPSIGKNLGCEMQGEEIILPFFEKKYRVSPEGIFGPNGRPPDLSLSVILCQYLFHNARTITPRNGWASFKDFPNAQPLVGSFAANVDRQITARFSGRLDCLAEACVLLGGRPSQEDLPYDLRVQFDALPQFPVLLLFNDADAEFSATCLMLFLRDADQRIDMESLAILGMLFAARLVHVDRRVS